MVTLSHPIGNANVRAAATAFAKSSILTEFKTAIACFPGDWLDSLGSVHFLSEIRRRKYDPVLKSVTETWPWFEVGRLLASKIKIPALIEHEKGIFSIDSVFRNFDRHVAENLNASKNRGSKIVYAFEDGAEFSFQAAKKQGLECFYDLPIGYWRKAKLLLEAEKERWPDWTPTLTGFLDSDTKLERKDEELRLADQIFVASKFTAKTLAEFPGTLCPIKVIPYGFPAVTAERKYIKLKSRKLKLLFVGGLSQRKGIADLFAAVEYYKEHVELTVVGVKMNNRCQALNSALNKHKYIPSLPHLDILRLMQEHDVLIFPSLFEGFGLVITEAMSQGTPVITTDRTAGPEFIRNGENGWIVEAGSTEAIKAGIEQALSSDKKLVLAGQNAMETARLRPWEVYGKELVEAVKSSSIV